jgi:hypothetical protein
MDIGVTSFLCSIHVKTVYPFYLNGTDVQLLCTPLTVLYTTRYGNTRARHCDSLMSHPPT